MGFALLLEHWELVLLTATWTAFGIVVIRRRLEWQKRRFVQQVSFSLNTLIERDGSLVLSLRTLLEDNATNVWLNDFGVSRVTRAARRTTRENPFLQIADRGDRETVMIAALNVLSERFSDIFIAQAPGLPTVTGTFLFGIVWERYEEMKTQKLRVMVIKRADLERMFNDDESSIDSVKVAEESHRPRIKTLGKMFELWTSGDDADRNMIREVELGIAIPNGLEINHAR